MPAPRPPFIGSEEHAPATPSRLEGIADLQQLGLSQVRRTALCADSVAWLEIQAALPRRCHVITSLPDIGELKPRMTPAAYEAWFSGVITSLLEKLEPHSVAIFYQTDGRNSGLDGAWLDKGFLCTLGARAAGATMLWHKIVCAGRPAQVRTGRPAFAHLLCFSKRLRPAIPSVDVLPQRGHMEYPAAAGEAACSAAVQFVRRAHALRPGDSLDASDALRPALVLDPFCGYGSVLALASAWGLDSMGIDTNQHRCQQSLIRVAKSEDCVYDHNGLRIGPIQYWGVSTSAAGASGRCPDAQQHAQQQDGLTTGPAGAHEQEEEEETF